MVASVVVARTRQDRLEFLADGAKEDWTEASDLAARFQTLREATRAAMRLPSANRAFALPLTSAA